MARPRGSAFIAPRPARPRRRRASIADAERLRARDARPEDESHLLDRAARAAAPGGRPAPDARCRSIRMPPRSRRRPAGVGGDDRRRQRLPRRRPAPGHRRPRLAGAWPARSASTTTPATWRSTSPPRTARRSSPPQAGTVTWAGWRNNGGGFVIAINHGNGMQTVYNHLGSIWVSPASTSAPARGSAASAAPASAPARTSTSRSSSTASSTTRCATSRSRFRGAIPHTPAADTPALPARARCSLIARASIVAGRRRRRRGRHLPPRGPRAPRRPRWRRRRTWRRA